MKKKYKPAEDYNVELPEHSDGVFWLAVAIVLAIATYLSYGV